ncbi:autotransporter-associated beta strand repeat-containing protein [Kiritimatiellaeota bacterium B1221]|nr:autotransporter-associated beta strand repeat-containing protein [Kiritimatiellaeota bacterium B1221]
MTTSHKKQKHTFSILCAIVSFLACGSARGQVLWTGGTDDNWSEAGNWSGGTPAGSDVVFNDVDKSSDKDVTNSIVDSDLTLSSLSFLNTGNSDTDWQVVEVGSGRTLTLDGSGLTSPGNVLFVGDLTPTSGQTYTNAKMTGGGALSIDATDDDILVTKISSNHLGKSYLDLSGLSSFTADVANVYVGLGNRTSNTLVLPSTGAGETEITATRLVVGDSNGGSGSGMNILELGRSTTLNVDTISVGAPATYGDGYVSNWQTESGLIQFQDLSGDTPSLVIRASDGVGRVDLTVAVHDAEGTKQGYQNLTGDVDFTGGTVDALFDEVLIGSHNAYTGSGHTGGATGTLSMDAGTIDATSVVLGYTGYRSSSSAEPATGILHVSGGTFIAANMTLGKNVGSGLSDGNSAGRAHGTVNISGTGAVSVTGDLTMGSKTGGSTDVSATVDIAGGSLTVGGNMAEGNTGITEINSTVKLYGGTLDMTGGSIAVDTFTLESGTLKNLGEYNSGADLVKTGTGTLNIEGANSYTGATMINAGTLALVTAGTNNIANSSSIMVGDGATLDLTGVAGGFSLASGQTLGGDGTITGDLTFASGSNFMFSLTDTLATTGAISFDSFGIDDLMGLDSSVANGIYHLISGTVNSANISNLGAGEAYDLGDGKSAYFEIGSLDVVVIPEPSALALVLVSLVAVVGFRRRKA